MKKAIMPILSAIMGGILSAYLKDPFLAVLICIPIILIVQFILTKHGDRNNGSQ
jgi:uncharacterized membrane protein YoaK (UPF0700 family)